MSDDLNLDNDEQGEKGQIEFEKICIDAKLTCNKAQRDRAGFDYLINDRIFYGEISGLDIRQAPLSCIVQLKTIRADLDIIKLRLSSAEQLAKDPKPAFIYVFRMHPNGDFANSSLIHLRGDNLGKILKRLRQAEAEGNFAINKSYITFSVSSTGSEIAPTGAAFRSKIEECCGDDFNRYIAEKSKELNEIGFKSSRYKINMKFSFANENEFTELMLGIRSNVPVSISDHVETRFGIDIKRDDVPKESNITFNPVPSGSCELIFRKNKYTKPAVFSGLYYKAPRLSDRQKLGAISVQNKLISMIATINEEKFTLRFDSPKITPKEPRLTPQEWLNYFRCALAISSDGFGLEIKPKNMKPLKLPNLSAFASIDKVSVTNDAELASGLIKLLDMTGASQDLTLSYNEFAHQSALIKSGVELISGESDPASIGFSAPSVPDLRKLFEITGLVINYMQLETTLIVWCADVSFEIKHANERSDFLAKTVDLWDIADIPIDHYEDYVSSMKQAGEFGIVVARELGSLVEQEDASPEGQVTSLDSGSTN